MKVISKLNEPQESASMINKIFIFLSPHETHLTLFKKILLNGSRFGAFSFVPLSEFVGRPSWTKSGP